MLFYLYHALESWHLESKPIKQQCERPALTSGSGLSILLVATKMPSAPTAPLLQIHGRFCTCCPRRVRSMALSSSIVETPPLKQSDSTIEHSLQRKQQEEGYLLCVFDVQTSKLLSGARIQPQDAGMRVNYRIIRRHYESPRQRRRSDWLFFFSKRNGHIFIMIFDCTRCLIRLYHALDCLSVTDHCCGMNAAPFLQVPERSP